MKEPVSSPYRFFVSLAFVLPLYCLSSFSANHSTATAEATRHNSETTTCSALGSMALAKAFEVMEIKMNCHAYFFLLCTVRNFL